MILSQKHTKCNTFSNLNIKATFDNKTVSNNASYTYVEAFKKTIRFNALIRNTISYQKPANSIHSVENTIEYMIDASILGYHRFMHMDDLRKD